MSMSLTAVSDTKDYEGQRMGSRAGVASNVAVHRSLYMGKAKYKLG